MFRNKQTKIKRPRALVFEGELVVHGTKISPKRVRDSEKQVDEILLLRVDGKEN